MLRQAALICAISCFSICCGGAAPGPGAVATPAPAPAPTTPPPTAQATPPAAPAAGPTTTPAPTPATIHASAIVIDTHDDITQRLVIDAADLGKSLPDAQTDIPRMQAGGLDAEFLSVWVAPMLYPGEKAYAQSLAQFSAIDAMIGKNTAQAVLARTAGDVRAAAAAGKTAFLIGVEGGHSLGEASDDELLKRLKTFYDRGARYMTLTWSNSNRLGGSSGDAGKAKGLSPFGRRVVAAMNDLGMMVDISHVSDATFTDAVKASRLPVLASHSSARALSPHARNMTDDMLKAVGANGGAVCVNFGPEFLDAEWDKQWKAAQGRAGIGAIIKAHPGDFAGAQREIWAKLRALAADIPAVPASKAIDHIEHIAKVAGVDHTCLGSDFDGIPAGPSGLDDVSHFPLVTEQLLARGFSESDVRKILGENVLRVLDANERGRAASK